VHEVREQSLELNDENHRLRKVLCKQQVLVQESEERHLGAITSSRSELQALQADIQMLKERIVSQESTINACKQNVHVLT
jgi:hypothetical protein